MREGGYMGLEGLKLRRRWVKTRAGGREGRRERKRRESDPGGKRHEEPQGLWRRLGQAGCELVSSTEGPPRSARLKSVDHRLSRKTGDRKGRGKTKSALKERKSRQRKGNSKRRKPRLREQKRNGRRAKATVTIRQAVLCRIERGRRMLLGANGDQAGEA